MKEYINDPPPADQRVTELHVWIATHPDTGEGIASADIDFGGDIGSRHTPLMSSKRKIAERMQVIVDDLRQQALVQAGARVTFRLVTFRKVEE